MKKINLIKRASAFMLSLTIAGAMLPTGAMAETSAPAGKAWETVAEVDMDGFTATCDDYNATGAIWGLTGTKTVGDTTYTLKTNGGTDPWIVGRWSTFLNLQDENKETMNNNAPTIIKNNRLFRLNRQYTWAEDWSISGTPSSKSGIYLNALQPGDVSVGDRIRITAWVYVDDLSEGDQNQDVNVRMWLMNPWVSNDNTGYNPGDPGNAEEAYVGKMPASTWTPISFEYTVNTTNESVYNVSIDNYTESGSYPRNMYLAGVKTEKLVDVLDPDILTRTNMDGFSYTGGPSIWGFTATKTANNRTYTVGMVGGAHPYIMNPNGGVIDNTTAVTEGMPSFAGSKVAVMDRHKTNVGGFIEDVWHNEVVVSSDNALIFSDLYSDSDVSVGDRLRVSAWVFANDIYTAKNKAYEGYHAYETYEKAADQTQNVNFRAFIYGSDGYNNNAAVEDITCTTQLAAGQWHRIDIEYTVTDANKGAKILRIDNKTDGDTYPLYLALAGVQVENITDEGTYSISGDTASGTINVRSADPAEGSIVIAAAYQGNTFLGCNVQDFTTDTVSFSISGATNADSVRAFIWNKTTLAPYTKAITLQKTE